MIFLWLDLMRAELVDLFPTALGIYQWDREKNKELKELVRELIKSRTMMPNPMTQDITHFYNVSGENFLDEDYPIIKEFNKFLDESFVDYTKEVQKLDIPGHIIPNCWVNVTKKGGWQYKHSHANCFVSGTYYLNFPYGSTGITFSSNTIEKTSPYFSVNPTEQSRYNSESLTMMPEECILFLWPSNLTHETQIQDRDARRVSISMNFVPTELDTGIYRMKISR